MTGKSEVRRTIVPVIQEDVKIRLTGAIKRSSSDKKISQLHRKKQSGHDIHKDNHNNRYD